MRVTGVAVLLMFVTGCGPSDEQLAQQCGVSVEDLKRTKLAVDAMQPYAGAELGKCSVIKDDSGPMVIPPDAKRNADLMVKEEAILNGIADRCAAARSVWRVASADQVQFVPEGASTEKVNCLMSEFRKKKLPLKLRFIAEPAPETRK